MGYTYEPSRNASIDIYSEQEQFMFGDAFLVSPVVKHREQYKKIYLPNDTFYNFSDGKQTLFRDVEIFIQVSIDSGTVNLLYLFICLLLTINNIFNNIVPIFMRAGYIVPLLQSSKNDSKIDLHIALKTNPNGTFTSKGAFILDDGESLHIYSSSQTLYADIEMNGTLSADTEEVNEIRINLISNSQHVNIRYHNTFGDVYLYG
jgi:alpha-glucosidase (family GH31 glycosyl hydrolase)